MAHNSERLDVDGFLIVPSILSDAQCDALAERLQAFEAKSAGKRTLLGEVWCADIADQLRQHPVVSANLSAEAIAVQCTLFDKSPARNWLVSLHQDLSIPVSRRVDSPECSAWSMKEGQLYVQPPATILDQLLAVRVHVDPCPAESGALRIVPGSHTFGRLELARAAELRADRGEQTVPVSRGGALLMRPLLLHASSKASTRSPRRVLHFVFGPRRLPAGLAWQLTNPRSL